MNSQLKARVWRMGTPSLPVSTGMHGALHPLTVKSQVARAAALEGTVSRRIVGEKWLATFFVGGFGLGRLGWDSPVGVGP